LVQEITAQPVQPQPALLFDLDGTLVDSVYQHVLAWREALEEAGIELSVWRIHRRIGMSGGLFVNALSREMGRDLGPEESHRVQHAHARFFARQFGQLRPLPGSRQLLEQLSEMSIPWAIVTSSSRETAIETLRILDISAETPLVTHDEVPFAKPDPHLFLTAAAVLKVDVQNSIVVGDSVWDMLAAQRARALGVGLLSGGYGREELEAAGAFRVYADPADLRLHIDELGIRVARG
jgi:HAD superfamily hydrolase (TIGR01509 family)